MSQRIIIAIEVPDGVNVKVTHAAVEPVEEPGFGTEPLPVETFGSEETWAPATVAPPAMTAPAQPPIPFRTAATQHPPRESALPVGAIHVQGHKPLKLARDGRHVYCPTAIGKGPDGKTEFCDFRASAA